MVRFLESFFGFTHFLFSDSLLHMSLIDSDFKLHFSNAFFFWLSVLRSITLILHLSFLHEFSGSLLGSLSSLFDDSFLLLKFGFWASSRFSHVICVGSSGVAGSSGKTN